MNRRSLLSSFGVLLCNPAFALYDPKPDAGLSLAQGEWVGTLTYRDYSKPDRFVTLKVRAFVALSAPSEVVLHYVFDDGPSKMVFSYERMAFDFMGQTVTWASGADGKSVFQSTLVSNVANEAGQQLTFEHKRGSGTDRYKLELSAKRLSLSKDEVGADGTAVFRNKYEFGRVAG